MFQLSGLRFEHRRGFIQVCFLRFENLGLLLQLRVGLFQLRLLLFEATVRFLERSGLFFEFFVGDPEFLALHLQLLGLPLSLLQEFLKPGPVLSRSDRHGDRFRDTIDELTI